MRLVNTPAPIATRLLFPAFLTVALGWLLLFVAAPSYAQNGRHGSNSPNASKSSSTPTRLKPVFPVQNPNLIFVEGEDAVVTNFDKQAILNYSASGLRTLQLSTTSDPTDSDGYYADYVFYVEKAGTYEFWYGGTPPGPQGISSPSYSSPFEYSLDGAKPIHVYSRDVSVVGSYTPSYYWNRVGTVHLAAGKHQLQFRVTQKRKYDNRYFFYLDCFFLVRLENGVPNPGSPLPPVFPAKLTGGHRGEPFKFIEDYLVDIRDHPGKVQSYIDLSLDYSLVNDNLNALKYLNRAGELDPKNETISLLKAKNLLWKGDVTNGLAAYRQLLNRDPANVDLWAEAGKVAAWSGRYSDSVSFFTDGLKHFPGNLNLIVNLGLTYLWSGNDVKAQAMFTQARSDASKNYARLMQLAQTLTVAQANDRAVSVYQLAIRAYPRHLDAYLALEKLYLDTGRTSEANKIHQTIVDSFVPSARLNRFLELAQIKENLKTQLIHHYEASLSSQPDNLGLRELLAKAYFWNGMQAKGTTEYLNILANYTYRTLRKTQTEAQPLINLLDRSYVFREFYQKAPGLSQELHGTLQSSLADYQAAAKALKDYQIKVAAARQKGQALPVLPSGQNPAQKLNAAAATLSAVAATAQGFLDRFGSVSQQLKEDENALAPMEKRGKKDQSDFAKLIGSTHWHWREADTMAELGQVRSSGAALASFSMATIDQIEGQLSSATDLFRNSLKQDPTVSRYELSQTLLWMGDAKSALAQLKKLPTGSKQLAAARPWVDLEQSLFGPLSSGGPAVGAPDQRLVQDILGRLDAASTQASKTVSTIDSFQSTMHGILRDSLVRAIYQNQEDTFSLRKDLGDYYLNQKKFDDAIRQFRQVLAIDPWNVGALFRLGQVYERKGNWKQALLNYEKVYYSDPTYENVAHQYNNLARHHPDTLSFDAQTTSDTQRLTFQGSATYTTPLNSLFGLSLNYTAATQRLFQPYSSGLEDPSYFRTSTVALAVPIDLYAIKLKITPKVGAVLTNQLDGTTATNAVLASASALTPSSYFGYLALDPLLEVDASMSIGKYIYMNGTYSYQRQTDTYVPARLKYEVFDNFEAINLSTNLGFLGGSVAKNSSVRLYGSVDLLSQKSSQMNYIWTALSEVDLGILNLDKPDTHLALVANAQLQNSRTTPQPDYLYYAPIGELLAGGGFQGSAWLPVGNDTVGVSLRTIASSYMQRIFSAGGPTKLFQLGGDARVEYDRGNSSIYLDANMSGTYQYDPLPPPPQGPWNYWTLTISFGYSAQLPTLLAP